MSCTNLKKCIIFVLKVGVNMDQIKIGKFISKCRKENNMTQENLAEKLGVNSRSVSRWETGKCMPDISLLEDLCKELGISINELIKGSKIMNNDIKSDTDKILKESLIEINKTKKTAKYLKIILIILSLFILFIVLDLISIGVRKMPIIILDVKKDDCECFHYKGLFYYTNVCDYDNSPTVSLEDHWCTVEEFYVQPSE